MKKRFLVPLLLMSVATVEAATRRVLTAADLDALVRTDRPRNILQDPAKDFAVIHLRLKAYERRSLLANLKAISAKGDEETRDKVAFLLAMLEEMRKTNTDRLRKRLAYNNAIPFYLEVLFSRQKDIATLVVLMNRLVETKGKVAAEISSALQDLCQYYLRPFVRAANLQPTKDQPRIWAEVDRPGLEKRIKKLPRNRRDLYWQVQVRDALRALDAARGIKHDSR
jgi:hypothetical protein